jgi:hypothetical protein
MANPWFSYDQEWAFNPYHTTVISVRSYDIVDDQTFLDHLGLLIRFICREKSKDLPLYQIEGPYRYISKSNKKQFTRSIHCILKIRICGYSIDLIKLDQFKKYERTTKQLDNKKERERKEGEEKGDEDKTAREEREHNERVKQWIPTRIIVMRSTLDPTDP